MRSRSCRLSREAERRFRNANFELRIESALRSRLRNKFEIRNPKSEIALMYLTSSPIEVASMLLEARASDGGICLFLGVVRNENEGRATVAIDYEAYGPMAEAEME